MIREGFDSGPVLRQLLLTVPAPAGVFSQHHRPSSVWVPHPRPTRQQMADVLGVSVRTINRWSAGGRIAGRDADRIAVCLGFHPAELWPEFFGAAA